MIWTKETPVILYGAAHSGILTLSRLTQKCNIISFIDKRANELKEVNGLPVHSLESTFFNEDIKRTSVVVVCVTNIFEHENIVFNLVSEGFNHIAFCSVDGSPLKYRSEESRRNIAEIYKSIENGSICLPITIISSVNLLHFEFKDSAIISKRQGFVVANFPAFYVFTRKKGNGNWEDSPLLTLFPHQEIFDWFSGNPHANSHYYVDLYCANAAKESGVEITERWRDNVLSSRRMVYERMKATGESSASFFIEHSVEAEWNQEGHINMISGKHRAAYLIHRKHQFVPLAMSEDDYGSFLNISTANVLISYCKQNNVFEMPYPIYHPLFYQAPYSPDSAYFELLLKLSRWLAIRVFEDRGVFNLKNLSIYDNTNGDFLPVLFAFCVFGCDVKTAYPIGKFDMAVAQLYHLGSPPTYCGRSKHCDVLISGYDSNLSYDEADYHIITFDNMHQFETVEKNSAVNLRLIHLYKNKLVAVGFANPKLK